jgi:hypothetical protein
MLPDLRFFQAVVDLKNLLFPWDADALSGKTWNAPTVLATTL